MTQVFNPIDSSVPSGDTGTSMATKLNDWRTTLISLHSGSSRPSYAGLGTMWLDTSASPYLLKVYNGSADITLLQIDPTNLRPIFPGAVPWVDGGGTGDAITATYSPAIGGFIDGMLLGIRATAANTITTPTFSPNGLTVKNIVKFNNTALVAGDIAGNSHELLLRYAADIDKWVLLNPAGVPSNYAKLDTEDQTLSGGARITEKDLGTVASGTLTPDPGDRPMQKYTNNGAHTLAPGSNVGSYLLTITNGASAGAITVSGWTKVAGDAFTTVNGQKFRCAASIDSNGSSLLQVQAMQ